MADDVRVGLSGHLPFVGAVKGVYDTLKALRDGVNKEVLVISVSASYYVRGTLEFLMPLI